MNGNTMLTQDRSLISDKELHYIKDFMSWELLGMKKCHEAIQLTQDPQIQQLFRTIGAKHQQHYEQLLNHLH